MRLVVHAGNTESQVKHLANCICEWAKEMLDIELGRTTGVKFPFAARKVYALMTALDVQPVNPSAKVVSLY